MTRLQGSRTADLMLFVTRTSSEAARDKLDQSHDQGYSDARDCGRYVTSHT